LIAYRLPALMVADHLWIGALTLAQKPILRWGRRTQMGTTDLMSVCKIPTIRRIWSWQDWNEVY